MFSNQFEQILTADNFFLNPENSLKKTFLLLILKNVNTENSELLQNKAANSNVNISNVPNYGFVSVVIAFFLMKF